MDIELREGDVIEDVLRSRIERLKLKEPFTTAQVGSILSIRRERVNNLLWGNPPRLQASRVPTGRSQSIRCTITFHDLLKYMEENDPRIAIRERQYRVSEAIGEERLEAEYARLMKLTNDLGFHEPLTVQEVAKLFGKSLPRVYEAARSYGPTRLLPWFDPTPAIFGKTVYRFWLRGVAFYACIAHLDERERHEASRRKKFDLAWHKQELSKRAAELSFREPYTVSEAATILRVSHTMMHRAVSLGFDCHLRSHCFEA